MKSLIAAFVLAALIATPAPLSADEPDVRELLRQADDAAKAVQSVSYEARFYGVGDLADRLPRVSGNVAARKGTAPGFFSRLTGRDGPVFAKHIEAHWTDSDGGDAGSCDFSTDGQTAWLIDRDNKLFLDGPMPATESAAGPGVQLMLTEYVHPTPFKDEVDADEARHEGTKKVGGVECDVIYIRYAGGQGEARWYFARKDHLPRRVDRLQGKGGGIVLTLKNLKVDPALDDAVFAPSCPDGFERKRYAPPSIVTPRLAPTRNAMLLPGARAPNWELKTPDGETIGLKRLRGNVVVLEFWATWCGSCRAAAATVEKLHQKYQGRPVAVYGLHCWDGGDPAQFMRKRQLTYGILLDCDEAAKEYKIRGVPSFYVIGPTGRIVQAELGYSPDLEDKLARAIDAALLDVNP